MKTVFKKVAVVMIMALMALTLGCNSTKNQIVAKWDSKDIHESLEFFKDGTVVVTDTKQSTSMPGKWSKLDDGRIKLDVTALGMPMVMLLKVSFASDEMTVFNEETKDTVKYIRVKS